MIANEPFRERALELTGRGFTWSDIADWLGWYRATGATDTHRVKRVLGLSTEGRGRALRTHIQPTTALSLCEALGLDPVDVGL